jgi:hypothetical protein
LFQLALTYRYGVDGFAFKICERVWFGGLREGAHWRNQNDCNGDGFDGQFHTKHFLSWLDCQHIVLGRSESRIVGVQTKSHFFQCTFARTVEIFLLGRFKAFLRQANHKNPSRRSAILERSFAGFATVPTQGVA